MRSSREMKLIDMSIFFPRRVTKVPEMVKINGYRGCSLLRFRRFNTWDHFEGVILQRDYFEGVVENSTGNNTKRVDLPKERNPRIMKNERLKKVLEKKDKLLEERIRPRVAKLQQFIGDRMLLLTTELVSILCGSSDFSVIIDGNDSKTSVFESQKLRLLGKLTYNMARDQLVFGDEQYLSSTLTEVQTSLTALNEDDKIIPLFMRKNLIYNSVIPFMGVMKYGLIKDTNVITEAKTRISDLSAIGTFYTMIGVLVVKYGTKHVEELLLGPKVINGNSGVLSIVTEMLRIRQV